ncbi:MAG TPA: methyltransferase [Longimicrobium sp.]|nr:methyltransferase [Longimicrobium sp.]
MSALRHLVAILLLPFTVTVVVPRFLLSALAAADTRWGDAAAAGAGRAAGAALLVAGLALFAWCVALFARVGRGTLAPWDPTRALVAAGPYRLTRNPMITGVAAILVGEALWMGSRVLGGWAAVFIVINHLYFVLSEEPGLERRFGEGYRAYRAAVPRWLPRPRRRAE